MAGTLPSLMWLNVNNSCRNSLFWSICCAFFPELIGIRGGRQKITNIAEYGGFCYETRAA